MDVFEKIDGMESNYEGLWYHNENHNYTSAIIDLEQLKKFKGKVQIVMFKNRFHTKENGKPNFIFKIVDKKLEAKREISFSKAKYDFDGTYRDENGNKLFTYDEVNFCVQGATRDAINGYTDNIVEDYVDVR